MNKNITVALDAMGGDNAPAAIIDGALAAIKQSDVKIILVGQQEKIYSYIEKKQYDKSRILIHNAEEVITNDEQPAMAIREKKNSSIVVGLNLVKKGEADAFVSAGSTGALLVGATLIVGRIKGVERPALASFLPTKNGVSLLLDLGANVDAKPSYLLQFAKMGSVYVERFTNKKNPKVALVNIGTEKEKGNALTKEAYELLEGSGLNFIGNVEAREIPMDSADVFVCDAFVGNVILKLSEGLSSALLSMIKKEITSTFLLKLGAMILKPAFSNIKKKMDYSEYGGAPFLGLKSLVVKAHGSSNEKAIKYAILQCISFSENNINENIKQALS